MKRAGLVYVVGQAIVDVMLRSADNPTKLRLGGILHAARTLWAMNVPYGLAYIAPDYLRRQTELYALHHGANIVQQVGSVQGAPNVILIEDPTEAGAQGYELLLRDEQVTEVFATEIERIARDTNVTEVFIFPGGFDLPRVLRAFHKSKARMHIDIANGVDDITQLTALRRKFAVISSSTSSDLFLTEYAGDVLDFVSALAGYGESVLFKENRGGARLFRGSVNDTVMVPAHLRPILHSVGIGDCYDVVFGVQRVKVSDSAALSYASCISAEYAATTFPDDFRQGVTRALAIPPEVISEVRGVSLPWEARPSRQIYIAAPDFDFMNTQPIDRICDALCYHNFIPRRPVREHGQIGTHSTAEKRAALCAADLELMNKCDMMIGILLSNDPGTLIEIGMAVQQKMPVIVYDPYEQAQNLMLIELPNLVSHSLDAVISEVFRLAARS
jgi:nucleoside 2-deoxyribosyltransferase